MPVSRRPACYSVIVKAYADKYPMLQELMTGLQGMQVRPGHHLTNAGSPVISMKVQITKLEGECSAAGNTLAATKAHAPENAPRTRIKVSS